MEAHEKKTFDEFISSTFPEEKKRTRSAVIHRSLSQRIINYLKGNVEEDKAFRHYVKKTRYSLMNLPAAGLRDVLVVAVKEEKQVSRQL